MPRILKIYDLCSFNYYDSFSYYEIKQTDSEEFNQEYNLDSILKKKKKERNMDIHVSQMDNYEEIQKKLEKNAQNLEKANKKTLKLKQNFKDIKDKIDKIKTSKLNKENYILSKSDKESFINFINQLDNTNKEYDKLQSLSITLTNVDEQLKREKDDYEL